MGGTEIFVERVAQVGTLGFLAQDNLGSPEYWIVSCYHVLVGRPDILPVPNEPVLQPCSGGPAAFVDASRCDPVLDCAAAKVPAQVGTTWSILNVGEIGSPVEPRVGMRVIKAGAFTGVTEGVILSIEGDDVIVGSPPGFDPEYELSGPGDSGALWLSQDQHSPVAVHVQEIRNDSALVVARRIDQVLKALGLRIPLVRSELNLNPLPL